MRDVEPLVTSRKKLNGSVHLSQDRGGTDLPTDYTLPPSTNPNQPKPTHTQKATPTQSSTWSSHSPLTSTPTTDPNFTTLFRLFNDFGSYSREV